MLNVEGTLMKALKKFGREWGASAESSNHRAAGLRLGKDLLVPRGGGMWKMRADGLGALGPIVLLTWTMVFVMGGKAQLLNFKNMGKLIRRQSPKSSQNGGRLFLVLTSTTSSWKRWKKKYLIEPYI